MADTDFDSDLNFKTLAHIRHWVTVGAAFVFAGYILSLGTIVLTVGLSIEQTGDGLALLGSVVGLVLAIRNRVRAGGMVVLASVWLELHFSVLISGSLPTSGTPVLPVLVYATVLFLGGHAAVVLACVTSVAYPISAWIGAEMLQLGPGIESALTLVILIVTLLVSAVLGHLGLSSFRDVLQDALANERKFSSLVRHAPFGIVVLDPNGRIVAVNPKAGNLLPAGEQEMLHEPFIDILSRVTLQNRSELPVFDGGTDTVTEVVLAPDENTRVNVELMSRPTVLTDGREGTQVILHDVTEQREMERRSVQLAHLYDESLSEAYAFDVETLTLKFVNRATRSNLGYMLDELDALTVTEINPDIGPKRARRLVTELGSDAHAFIQERGKHKRKDGTSYPVELRMQLLAVDGRQTVSVLALDISRQIEAEAERKRLRGRLETMQRIDATGRLAGAVAHDFSKVLEVIGGYAESILGATAEQDVLDWAAGIREAQTRGLSLAQGLLGCSRQDMIQEEPLSLSEILQDLRTSIQSILGDQIVLSLDTSEPDLVRLDRAQLENLVLSLVGNAADAMPDGGTLAMTVSPLEGADGAAKVCFETRDNGMGMDPPTLKQAFEPLFTTKPAGMGTGLGLSSVHGIVTLSGGIVELESELGQGTTVRIEWPAAVDTDMQVDSGDPPAHRRDGSTKPATILVVDDDETTLDHLEDILIRAGYDVHGAGSAEESLVWLDQGNRLDLLVTDVMMPGRSGFELGEEIQARFPAVPVLYVSGYLMSGYQDAFSDVDGTTPSSGVNFLLKPFSSTDLLDRIERSLRGNI